MNTNRDTLIELLLAGELSVELRDELYELAARDPSVAEDVLDQMWLEPLLSDAFASDPDTFVQRIEAALGCDDSDTSQFTAHVLDAWSDRVQNRSRRRRIRVAGWAMVTFLVCLTVLLFRPDAEQGVQAAMIRLQSAVGSVNLVTASGEPRAVEAGMTLHAGDTLTIRDDSSALLVCTDGSYVTLTRDASLTWSGNSSGRVVLNSGAALITNSALMETGKIVTRPLVVQTQHATVDVPDTRLFLATSDRRTDVVVSHGQTTVEIAGGQRVTVSGGECVVTSGESVELRRGLATPDQWDEDFEAGVPDGWTGHPVGIGKALPAGSRGAVGTAASQNEAGEDCHQIWSRSDWQHGLAAVHADTCLRFVYRFQKSDRVQILTLLRSPLPESAAVEVQMLQPADVSPEEQWWNIPSREWYVATIPISRLSDPVTREHPDEVMIATAFNFRPQDHACGLVIDHMWLERGTSETIEFAPLQ